MKTKKFPFIEVALTAFLVTPIFALEAPEDDAPPPPAVDQHAPKLPEIKLPQGKIVLPNAEPQAEAPFLGVVSGEVPEMLAEHLDLKPGEGIVVRSVVPDGPAARSGVVVNDVITKVAGQPVGSSLDVSHQISGHKPGEKVSLDLIHKGKPTSLDVTLGVRPAEIAAAGPQPLDPLNLDGFPKELADRVRDAIAGNIGRLDLQLGGDEAQVDQRVEQALRDVKKRMQGAMQQNGLIPPAVDAGGKFQIQGGATVRMNDQEGSVEVKSTDGAKEVTIRDRLGKVIWSGPWDTAQDKAAAPADARQRVESLNIDSNFNGNGLRLQMRQAAPPDPGDH